ncbi:VOC family protein [Luteithermobacter gelatinilyticus]|uniref:VOC family protein n=1 Tax=Luteithermobacter gelatinilyticus TaxID=2582913 RepID=UPI001106EA95|nr:VOC family protein [Luteithermobacter gelatinilyticus]
MRQPLGSMMQLGYIVENLEDSMDHWSRYLNTGPFTVFEDFQVNDPLYRGRPMQEEKFRVAMAYTGNMLIELIQQVGAAPSVYQEVIRQRGYGFHHWAYITKNFDDEVRKYRDRGLEVCFFGSVPVGARFAYIDATAEVGSMIEIIEHAVSVEAFFNSL